MIRLPDRSGWFCTAVGERNGLKREFQCRNGMVDSMRNSAGTPPGKFPRWSMLVKARDRFGISE